MESGMQTPDDVARALGNVSHRVALAGFQRDVIRDIYGNTVGHYCLTDTE